MSSGTPPYCQTWHVVFLVANSRVFDEFHFGSALAGYVAAGTITQLDFRLWGYYDDSVQHDHVNETGIVIIFNRV